jgi:hypothetical protein
MTLTQLLPLLTAAGVGATQQEEIMAMLETPINIARVAAVQAELSNIRKLVRLDMITDNLPRNFERKFQDYVRQYMESEGRDTSIDFWGNPYQMQEYDDEYQFWSYGPDGIDDTEDDVWTSLKKQDFTL